MLTFHQSLARRLARRGGLFSLSLLALITGSFLQAYPFTYGCSILLLLPWSLGSTALDSSPGTTSSLATTFTTFRSDYLLRVCLPAVTCCDVHNASTKVLAALFDGIMALGWDWEGVMGSSEACIVQSACTCRRLSMFLPHMVAALSLLVPSTVQCRRTVRLE